MASNSNSIIIPKFDGGDYEYWSVQMKTLLIKKGYWDIMVASYIELTYWIALSVDAKKETKENERQNSMALSFIQETLDRSIFPRISACVLAQEAWAVLREGYQGSLKLKEVKLQTLRREFENMKQEEETVEDYYVRVKAIVNKMATLREKIEKEVFIKKVLRTLIETFDHAALIIEETKDLSSLEIDNLIGSLTSHEERMMKRTKARISNRDEQAFSIKENEGQGRGQGRGARGRGRTERGGRRGSFGRGRGREKNSKSEPYSSSRRRHSRRGIDRGKDKRNMQCFYCNRFGHFEYECRTKQPNEGNATNYGEEEHSYGEEQLFLSMIDCEKLGEEAWLLDSGCSKHMIDEKSLLSAVDYSYKSNMWLGNEKRLEILVKREMQVPTRQGTMKVKNIYYTPNLKQSLLSLAKC